MRPRSVEGYIQLGIYVWYLTEAKEGNPIYQGTKSNQGISFYIGEILNGLNRYELIVTANVASPIKSFADQWTKQKNAASSNGETLATWEDGQKLSDAEAKIISTNGHLIHTVLLNESRTKIAYIIAEGKYASTKLLQNVDSLMPSGLFEKLTPIGQFDITQAGKALALELPTAAAFHVLRATEEVLRDLYLNKVKLKKNRIKEPYLWFAMTDHLGKLSRPVPNDLLGALDYIRVNFRNPTNHPDSRFTQDEAESIFSLCVDAISRIQKYLEK